MYKYEKCVQQKFKQSSCQVLPLIVHMTFKAEDVCGTAGSSGTLRACRSHQLCEGTCWAKQEAATWACSASRDLWPPDCSWCMQSTLLLTPHGDAGCLSHYMLLTLKLVQYLNIQELMASGRSSRGWFSSIKLWSIRRWTFGFTDHHLPCLALRGSHLKLHPDLSISISCTACHSAAAHFSWFPAGYVSFSPTEVHCPKSKLSWTVHAVIHVFHRQRSAALPSSVDRGSKCRGW